MNRVVWNPNLTAFVTRAFLEENGVEKTPTGYSIDPTICTIRRNVFGFYDLMFNDRIIRRLSFPEFLELKDIVKEVQDEELIE